jgi:2-dehydro-3-deoxygalactonokinase
LINGTFIGKCVVDDHTQPLYTLDEIIDVANEVVRHSCLLRAMLMPRFMQVLMDSSTIDRRNFINACIAVEDLNILCECDALGFTERTDMYLFGNASVCDIYRRLLERRYDNTISIVTLTEKNQTRDLTIAGSLAIMQEADLQYARS